MSQPFDLRVLQFFDQFTNHAPNFDELVRLIAANDLVKGGLLISLLWWFWLAPHRDRARRRELVVASVAGAIAAVLIGRSLMHLLPVRPRPFEAPGLNPYFRLPPAGWEAKTGSFPSDHAALAFGLVAGFFFLSPTLGLGLAAYVIVFVCLPRAYLRIHWATDLLGGAFIGILSTSLLALPRVRSALARPALRWLDRSAASFYVGMFLLTFSLMTRFDSVRYLAGWTVRTIVHAGHSADTPLRSAPVSGDATPTRIEKVGKEALLAPDKRQIAAEPPQYQRCEDEVERARLGAQAGQVGTVSS